MVEPIFAAATERTYYRLPQFMTTEDANQNWTLKKFLASITDQLDAVETLYSRINYIDLADKGDPTDVSDLVNPNTADAAWLPWLAQVTGQQLRGGSDAYNRSLLANPSKFQSGTKAAIAEAAKGVLTGTQFVRVYDHTTNVSAIGAAGQWDVLIVTRATETTSDPAAEVIRLGLKPAGIKLWTKTFVATWNAIEAAYPTWNGWESAGTWSKIEEAGF